MFIRIMMINLFPFSIMLKASQCQPSEIKITSYTNSNACKNPADFDWIDTEFKEVKF